MGGSLPEGLIDLNAAARYDDDLRQVPIDSAAIERAIHLAAGALADARAGRRRDRAAPPGLPRRRLPTPRPLDGGGRAPPGRGRPGPCHRRPAAFERALVLRRAKGDRALIRSTQQALRLARIQVATTERGLDPA